MHRTVATAGTAAADGRDLVIVSDNTAHALIVASPDAGTHERAAVDDLAGYIERITGARPEIVADSEAVKAALDGDRPLLVVGQAALAAEPSLQARLDAVVKPEPLLQADAIVLLRDGNRVYLVGVNDQSHYYAVAALLHKWGCRWYMPTEFGECIPEIDTLTVGNLDHAHGSPFEVRGYWISWVGDRTGTVDFQRRNMMGVTGTGFPNTGHALGKYTRGAPDSKGVFNFPITAPETAQHVAEQVEPMYARGENFSLGMEDGSYDSDYPPDQELMKLQWDKYFLRWSVTDAMLELYNNVARILREKHPDSDAKIGFLAYANMTLPPVRDMIAEPALYAQLAPIDIDPIHGMDHPDSIPRQEYRDMLYAWAEVMQGRLAIYDYDQGMLVWRDIPNPSHMAFRQDVKHYRDAGILGVSTESRAAFATIFINLYLRGHLMWDPDVDVDALIDEFYPAFYGPAADPMRVYWTAIYDAWENSIVTEHEHFVAPAIYTPEVIAILARQMDAAEKAVSRLTRRKNPSVNEQRYLERVRFTRLSYEVIRGYMGMVRAAGTDIDYAEAVAIGERTLEVRKELSAMHPMFTTLYGESQSPAWWPGEVEQYRRLNTLIDGAEGRLLKTLPLEWAFRRDPDNRGLDNDYAAKPIDFSVWEEHKDSLTVHNRKDYPDAWEMLRTDLYAQAQGIRHPDHADFTGYLWYRTDIELTDDQLNGAVHIMFPGLFNECWLYVNGKQVAHRPFANLWWYSDYRFEWDVDLSDHLRPGVNTIALRAHNPHHMGGMFRRPFLYQPIEP